MRPHHTDASRVLTSDFTDFTDLFLFIRVIRVIRGQFLFVSSRGFFQSLGIYCEDQVRCSSSDYFVRIVQQLKQKGHGRPRIGAHCRKCPHRADRQPLLMIAEFPRGVQASDEGINKAIKAGFPDGRLINHPLHEIWNAVCAKTEKNLAWLWFRNRRTVTCLLVNVSYHPVTQLLPLILRLRLGSKNHRDHTNQHPNSNQDQNEASSLFHGPTIMRLHAAEASRKEPQRAKFSQKQTKITKRDRFLKLLRFLLLKKFFLPSIFLPLARPSAQSASSAVQSLSVLSVISCSNPIRVHSRPFAVQFACLRSLLCKPVRENSSTLRSPATEDGCNSCLSVFSPNHKS